MTTASHPCPLCGSPALTSICATCASDLTLLGATLPDPMATKEEVLAWAKENKVSVFVCERMPM